MSDSENRLTRASDSSASGETQSESRVDTSCDALLNTVKSTCDPFKETFSSKGSALHHVSEAVNALASLQGAPSQLLNTGIAQIPLLDKVPGMPAATIGAAHLGTPHAHDHPPSDGFPLPSMGATIGSGCLSVLIGGMPAARVTDIGIAPTCGGLTPFFDIQTGSSNTFIGGMRAVRMGIDMTRHCNPMGHAGKSGEEAEGAAEKGEEAASEVAEVSSRARWMGRAGKAWKVGNAAVGPMSGGIVAADDASQGEGLAATMMAAQTAADLAVTLLSNLMSKDPGIEPSMGMLMDGNQTVLIGGFPMPDSQMMWHGGKHGIGKKVIARRAARKKGAAPCRDGHPVDVVRGTAENEFVDYATGIAPAFKWERFYCSGWCDQDGPLGFGFRHCFQHELHLLRTRAIYVDSLNREYLFRRNGAGGYEDVFAGYELEQCDAHRFILRHGGPGNLTFERGRETGNSARLVSHFRDGVESTLHYSGNGALRRITQTDERSRRRQWIDFRYDDRGHIVELRQTDAQGVSKRIVGYEYDAAGCLMAITDLLGAVMSHGYDGQRKMIRETDANAYSFFYRYDGEGRCVESTGQDGLLHVALDYQPGRTVVTRADGGKWTFLYDKAQTVTRIVDPYGGATERVTGDDGRIVREVDSGGRVVRWLYDEREGNTGRLDRWGNRWPTRDEAPVLPNPLAHVVPATPLKLLWGDARLKDLTDRLLLPPEIEAVAAASFPSRVVMLEPSDGRDMTGRVIAHTDEYGHTECLGRDAAGNLVKLRDKDGRDYRYAVKSWNLRESETDPMGNTVRYRYSVKGEITAVIDANGNESTYTHDFKGRVASVARHGVLRETYKYDDGDRLIEKCDGAGNLLLRYEVGGNGLHRQCILSSGGAYIYEYDARGHFTRASKDKVDVVLTHNARGRRISDKRGGNGVEHTYIDGRLAETAYLNRFVVRYEARPTGEVVIDTPVGGEQRFTRTARHEILLCLGSGTHYLVGFDARGRCAGRLIWREGAVRAMRCFEYQYSATGELRRVVGDSGSTTEYAYDEAHRLIGETHNGWPVRRFDYDCGGNLLSTPAFASMCYAEGNRLKTSSNGTFRYNDRNHLAQQIDRDGRQIFYHYDSMDLLVKVTWSDRPEVWTAEYDGLSRRIAKALGQARTDYYWDGDRLAAEVAPNGRLRIYVYVNETSYLPFMFIDYDGCDAAPESGRGYYVFSNQVGLPEWIEDTAGVCVWRAMEIDPYGAIRVAPGNELEYDLRWPGHWFDPETGLHYNRFRSYHPALGRYLQSDPAGQAGGINLYSYTANPLVFVDVLGRECPHGNKSSSECSPCENREEVERLAEELKQLKERRSAIEDEVSGHPGTLLAPGEYTEEYKQILKDIDTKQEATEAALLREKYPSIDDANLPPFNGITYGLMFYTDASGRYTVRDLRSGDKVLSNYDATGHVEGKAALIMRKEKITEAVVIHNHPGGTCNYCNGQVETLLPKNAKLRVIPPENAKAPTRYWFDQPKVYVGNPNDPKAVPKK